MSSPSICPTAGSPPSTAPRFVINVYTDCMPDTLPDGLPGFTAAYATTGRLARACWDARE